MTFILQHGSRFLMLLLVLVSGGCSSIDSGWNAARTKDTIPAYREFIRDATRDPATRAAALVRVKQASERLDTLVFEAAMSTGSIESTRAYIAEFPSGKHVADARLTIALKSGTEEACTEFLRDHPKSSGADEVRTRLDDIRYAKAMATNTVASLETALKASPESRHAGKMRDAVETLLYEGAGTDLAALASFVERFPTSARAGEVRRRIERAHYDRAKTTRTAAALEEFLTRYPKSESADEMQRLLEEVSFDRAKTQRTAIVLEAFLARFPDGAHAPAARSLLEAALFEATGQDEAAQQKFLRLYPDSPHIEEVRKRIAVTAERKRELERFLGQHKPAILDAIRKELRENALDQPIGSGWDILVGELAVNDFDLDAGTLRVRTYTAMEGQRSRFSFGFIDHLRVRRAGEAWKVEIVRK